MSKTKRNRTAPKQKHSGSRANKSALALGNRPRDFGSAIDRFVNEIESLASAALLIMKTLSEAVEKTAKDFEDFVKDKGVGTDGKDGSQSYQIKPEDLASFNRHNGSLRSAASAVKHLPRMFLCSLVHQYDAFLGHLLRVAFLVRPELLDGSKRQLSFQELVALASVEAAREHIIEKDVEAVIRESHAAQFDCMESRFGLTLRKELPAWRTFIEITERRNLFVHCDGMVSSQYMSVCRQHEAPLPNGIEVGAILDVSPGYFSNAVECILEVGVKLGHVLWRKLQPDQLRAADEALHRTTYNVLAEERYSLAKILLRFAVDTLKKKSSEELQCMNLINLAIAHNFSGERQQALEILRGYDWSASEHKFKLAVAVLEHRYADAVKLMKVIGAHGCVRGIDYSSWPLFKEFRRRPEFLKAYSELFGKEFVLPRTDTEDIGQNSTSKQPTTVSRHKGNGNGLV